MIRDFIAIDFETANQQPSRVCSIGVVMVRNGQVADSFQITVFTIPLQPPADSSVIRYPITSCTPLQQHVATTSRIITMHWPMLKPALR